MNKMGKEVFKSSERPCGGGQYLEIRFFFPECVFAVTMVGEHTGGQTVGACGE